jgi:poly-beta-1,6-N-acetyl-D-glucosamine synthase
MQVIQTLFWISLSLLFFCYTGYGMLLFLLNFIRSMFHKLKAKDLPSSEGIAVTIIIAAYNEEQVLAQKIRNTLEIDYPEDKLDIIFVTDGSTDSCSSVLQKHPAIQWLHQEERKGKAAAINRAMQRVRTPVVVFSDANTLLNKDCIRNILSHYNDPKTGGVAGEKKIICNMHATAIGRAEGLYWQYESFMKKQDAGFYTVVGAAGELFSIRTSLFRELDDELVLDDFITSMQVCMQGYKIRYEPKAYATELPSASLAEEKKRKIRIAAGAYQSIGYLGGCLNFFSHPLLSFQYVSRRLFRWIACPISIFVLFISTVVLFYLGAGDLYTVFLYAQLLFYTLAALGWTFASAGKRTGILTVPFYFVFMNYCLVAGFIRFSQGRQSILWEKSLRQEWV